MANKANLSQYIMPAVFLVIVIAMIAVVGADVSGDAVSSTGEGYVKRIVSTVSECSDSDGGMKIADYGVATVGDVEYADACVARDVNMHDSMWPVTDAGGYQKEYYCYRGEAVYYTTSCDCSNGVCAEEYSRY